MDLHSPKDKILLKNCVVAKLYQLKLAKESPEIEDEISYYENLKQILKADDTENLFSTLKDSTFKENYRAFNEHILCTPAKEVAQEYVDLTKSLMLQHQVYSEEKFQQLKYAFYKGNEHLLDDSIKTKNLNKLEEEPSANPNNLTKEEAQILKEIDVLFKKKNPSTMSLEQFKEFSAEFRDLIKLSGIRKFQPFFEQENKTIADMKISYTTSDSSKSVYQTDFLLLDSEHQISEQSIYAPATTSALAAPYYQTLCYTYLEADKCAHTTDSTQIETKMNTFSKCYQRLKEMMPTFNITIANHSIFYINESNYEPSQDLEIASNTYPDEHLI